MDVQLTGVQKTLLFPLYGRAKLSKENNPLLTDHKAIEIVDKLNFDFGQINENASYAGFLNSLLRAKAIDDTIIRFLEQHPKASVVNLGCGLDTTFYRVDNHLINWYDVDLPDVIHLRRTLITETDRSKCIAASIFDLNWADRINPGKPVFFICAGVFEYFRKQQVIDFMLRLSDRFGGGEIIFNTTSGNPLNAYFSKRNMKRIGMDASPAVMGNIIGSLVKHKEKMTVTEYYPLKSRMTNKYNFDKKRRKQIRTFYLLMQTKMIHIRFLPHER